MRKAKPKLTLTVGATGGQAEEPSAPITELTAWTGATRFLLVRDHAGVMHGHVEWLASDMNEAFVTALQTFSEAVIRTQGPRLA